MGKDSRQPPQHTVHETGGGTKAFYTILMRMTNHSQQLDG